MFKKSKVKLILFASFLCVSIPAYGGFSYDTRTYSADAFIYCWANWEDDATYIEFEDQNSDPNTPIDAEVNYPGVYAHGWSTDGSSLNAEAKADDLSAQVSELYSFAFMDNYFEFQATTTAIHLQWDYSLYIETNGVPTTNFVYAYANVYSYLKDLTDNTYVFKNDIELEDSREFGDALGSYTASDSGTFNEIYPLQLGHEYLLYLDPNRVEAWIAEGGYAYAEASMSNITINTVPIPSALWLLGSGLIGIVGTRRKFKK